MYKNIGLTGGIGSGKNTVAKIFEEFGFYTIDSDVSSRAVMQKGGIAYDDIINYFGESILLNDGEINRTLLGSIVFSDQNKLKTLESIVHPAIDKYEKKIKGQIKSTNSQAVIITHAALLIESNSIDQFDMLIVVTASLEKRIERIKQRDNKTDDEIHKILNSQLNETERLKYANVIIDNSGSLDDLYKEVTRVVNLIKQLNYGVKHFEK